MSSVDGSIPASNPRGLANIVQRWPTALGILVAAGSVLGLSDGRDVASVVAASGFVYLAAAALGRPGAAWPAFGLTFVLVGLGMSVSGFDPVPWLIAGAVVLVVIGLAPQRWRPVWSLPTQAAAMLVLGATAVIALRVDATAGGVLVSLGLLAHVAWDVYHHRNGRVVARSFAEFCGVLDILVAVGVLVLTLTA
jgi:hypothetical protein